MTKSSIVLSRSQRDAYTHKRGFHPFQFTQQFTELFYIFSFISLAVGRMIHRKDSVMSNSTQNTRSATTSEYRIRASILFKHLKSDDVEKSTNAAKRFQRLPQFKDNSTEEIIAQQDSLQRKHALTVVALEQNFQSWAELKQTLDSLHPKVNLYPSRCGGFLNEWYGSYETAKEALDKQLLDKESSYLLPYKSQFFICGADYIIALGLDPDDTNWQAIGYNWAKPKDETAWQELFAALVSFEKALHI